MLHTHYASSLMGTALTPSGTLTTTLQSILNKSFLENISKSETYFETAPGKHLGDRGKLWKTRSEETIDGRGSSGINFPSYYPHVCKTHTAAQSQGVECVLFFFFLNSWSVGYTHENTVTASYKNKNETHLFLSYFVWNIKWFSLFVIASYMWCFIRRKRKQFLLKIIYNLKLFLSICRVALGCVKYLELPLLQ